MLDHSAMKLTAHHVREKQKSELCAKLKHRMETVELLCTFSCLPHSVLNADFVAIYSSVFSLIDKAAAVTVKYIHDTQTSYTTLNPLRR